jgi:hypothetical protein
MNARMPRTFLAALAATALVAGLFASGAVGASKPRQISPKRGAVLELGSRATFKAKDGTSAAKRYGVWITVSTSKTRTANGDLKQTEIGSFRRMKRKGSSFRYKTEDYSFDTWFMAREGTYYWQVYRIDCGDPSARDCHVHSKVRSFKVR